MAQIEMTHETTSEATTRSVGVQRLVMPEVPMDPDFLEPGMLYIWSLPHGQKKVVWLTPDKDGLAEYDHFDDDGDWWFFENNLAGKLYGPFSLA